MFKYLHERELDELYRTSTRTFESADGKPVQIEAYRLIWAWFDRLIEQSRFQFEAKEIIACAKECAMDVDVDLGTALGIVIDDMVSYLETHGIDATDDLLPLRIAQAGMMRFGSK